MPRIQNNFIKLQISSVLGSVLDYSTTIVLVEIGHVWYVTANVAGNLFGGSLQFLMNRIWTFKKAEGNWINQAAKFMLVFSGNILISAGGVYVLTTGCHLNYLLSKTVVSVLMGVTYNYFLQKKYVFR